MPSNFFILALLLILSCCVAVYGQDDLTGMWCERSKCICIMRSNSAIHAHERSNLCPTPGRTRKFHTVLQTQYTLPL